MVQVIKLEIIKLKLKKLKYSYLNNYIFKICKNTTFMKKNIKIFILLVNVDNIDTNIPSKSFLAASVQVIWKNIIIFSHHKNFSKFVHISIKSFIIYKI